MSHPTPQRFSGRAGSNLPGRVRRSLDAHTESNQRFGNTLEIAPDGRLEIKAARGGGLKQTKDGLVVDAEQIGDKNLPTMSAIQDIPSGSDAATVLSKVNELLSELRRTGRIRS